MNLSVLCVPPQQTGFVVLVVSWARAASILGGLTISSFQCDQSGFFQDHLKSSHLHILCVPLLHFQVETAAQITLLAEVLKKALR